MTSRLAAMITTPIACVSFIRAFANRIGRRTDRDWADPGRCHVIPFDGYAGAGRWP